MWIPRDGYGWIIIVNRSEKLLQYPTGQVRLQKAILQANCILFPPENLSNGHFVVRIVNNPHSSSLLIQIAQRFLFTIPIKIP